MNLQAEVRKPCGLLESELFGTPRQPVSMKPTAGRN